MRNLDMKIFKLIFVVVMAIRSICTEKLEATQVGYTAETVDGQKQSASLEDDVADSDGDDWYGRHLKKIELYTNDERCSNIGVCSDMDYGDKDVVASFSYKMQIRFTSTNTYEIKEKKTFFTLTFINSKFANFPLQLFYAFKVEELDFRNCSVESLKWDNFLGADNLSILLLSENILTDIAPSLFSLAENLSFLFLDSNRISRLHNDSFHGLTKLNFLDLHNNVIETLPPKVFSHLPALQQVNLAQNRIQFIKATLFSANPLLFSIHLQHNDLKEIPDYAFQHQKVIKYLDISHNAQLEVLIAANIRVENLWAKNCSISRVNVYGEAVHVDLQRNSIKELYFSKPEYLETLRLRDNALEQISSLSMTTNLRTLDVSNNPELKTLPDLMQIDSLERLDLSNTSLQKVPINMLISSNKLKSLNVSYNHIKEINPLDFKYLENLSQFYIHENNWNCYNLKILMDVVIKPYRISYTLDVYDENFVGEYIHGIKCMFRVDEDDVEYYADSASAQQSYNSVNKEQLNDLPSKPQENNQVKQVDQLRRELQAIVGIYEQKFSFVFNKLDDVDARLKEFERINSSVWQNVAIVI